MRMKTEREKDRIKERRKKGARKYGQSKLKEARKGVWSCGLAVVIFLVIAGMLLLAYLSRGKTAAYIGGLGMSAMIFSWIGFFMALRGFNRSCLPYDIYCRADRNIFQGVIINA